AAAAWPLGVLAQQRDRPRLIGVLMGFAETDEVWQTYLRVFRERLRDFGWTDGQNVKFDGDEAACAQVAKQEADRSATRRPKSASKTAFKRGFQTRDAEMNLARLLGELGNR
ncbi:MAG: hypothetical protein WBW27_13120, partial [Pseudolabrys sp.]